MVKVAPLRFWTESHHNWQPMTQLKASGTLWRPEAIDKLMQLLILTALFFQFWWRHKIARQVIFCLCAIRDVRLSLDNSDEATDRRAGTPPPQPTPNERANKQVTQGFKGPHSDSLDSLFACNHLQLCLSTQLRLLALCDVIKGYNTTSHQSRCLICLFHAPSPTRRSRKTIKNKVFSMTANTGLSVLW